MASPRPRRASPHPPPLRFADVPDLVRTLRPSEPVFCIRPRAIGEAAARFRGCFPGRTLYAVKCNPHPLVVRALLEAGVREFDVASLPEIALVRELCPGAGIHFMHPVKERRAIREAYHDFGVRHFVVDHADELEKVFAETGGRRTWAAARP